MKYGEEAVKTGQELVFKPIVRVGRLSWRIMLKRIVEHGEENG